MIPRLARKARSEVPSHSTHCLSSTAVDESAAQPSGSLTAQSMLCCNLFTGQGQLLWPFAGRTDLGGGFNPVSINATQAN
jgi:hypothetical protein